VFVLSDHFGENWGFSELLLLLLLLFYFHPIINRLQNGNGQSRDYSITVKIMNVIYLTGRCTGVGELRVGQVCSAIGRVGLPFP
jgi:hypothetical protein